MVSEVNAAQALLATGTPSPVAGTAAGAAFQDAYANAARRRALPEAPAEGGLRTLLEPLFGLNQRSADLVSEFTPVDGGEMRPGQMMMITMRSHEFLFHCELVANVANRASDGVQQLFRQQS